MKSKISLANIEFVPKIWSVLVYLIFLILGMVIFSGRKPNGIHFLLLTERFPDLYSHISNFTISLLICLVCGFLEAWLKRSLKGTFVVAFFLILSNFVYEWYIPFINTPDKMDAYFGFLGTALPFLYHIPNLKFGFQPNPLYKA